jgi:hypothetical protein
MGHRKADMSRSAFNLPIQIPYEAIEEEVNNDPSVTVKLQEMVESRAFAPC